MSDILFNVHNSSKKSVGIELDRFPDVCPCCHKGIGTTPITGFVHDNSNPDLYNTRAELIFQCPLTSCKRYFIGYYVQDNVHHGSLRAYGTEPDYELRGFSPYVFQKKEFPQEIEKTSSTFVEIYNEAAQAENRNLINVAGPGYRKALEFLVKDYLIKKYPAMKAEIRSSSIQKLIQGYFDDPDLKACAERAIWLGNDETHYLRIWKNKDINDLKRLITLSVNWIQNKILTEKYIKQMPKKKKP